MSRGKSLAVIAVILGVIAVVFIAWTALDDGDEERSDRPLTDAAEEERRAEAEARAARRAADSGQQSSEPAAVAARPTVFARAGWGGGPGQLGRSRPDEANPEAPMSLAQGPNGSVVVLDQVNGRLVRYGADGNVAGSTPLGMTAPQDLAIARDGTTAVLDRLVDRNVTIFDPSGREVGTLPIEGEGIDDGGGVTAVVVDGDDVYVERENGPLIRIGDLAARPADERIEVPGRPTRDGLSYILAGIIEAPAGRFFVNSIERATREHRFTRELTVPLFLRQIVLLDTDDAGIIYVAVMGSPYEGGEDVEEGRLLCLEPERGTTIGSAVLPPNTDPDETMREIIVLGSGGVLYSMRSDEGVSLGFFDCRGGGG